MGKSNRKKRGLLALTVVCLMLLSFITGVLVSDLIMTIVDNVPKTDIDVQGGTAATGDGSGGGSSEATEDTGDSGDSGTDATEGTAATAPTANADSEVEDATGTWTTHTSVEIFKAQYEDSNGQVVVRSAYGDKLIAPGTANSYYFDIKNTGQTPLYYSVKTEALLTFTVGGQPVTVPLEGRFYNHAGKYLLGSENSYADLTALDGLTDKGGISVDSYIRYTLDWRWPFEGDDGLDTLLGNLEVDGDELEVVIVLEVTCSEDPNASGGLPQTGDSRGTGLWVAATVGLLMLIMILFMAYRRESEDESLA